MSVWSLIGFAKVLLRMFRNSWCLTFLLKSSKKVPICCGTTKTGYGTTSVWCRDGSRNIEGCWGFPYLEIEKWPNFYFMFLIAMKFISTILKNCLRGSSSFLSVPVFTKFDKPWYTQICQKKQQLPKYPCSVSKLQAFKFKLSICQMFILRMSTTFKHTKKQQFRCT